MKKIILIFLLVGGFVLMLYGMKGYYAGVEVVPVVEDEVLGEEDEVVEEEEVDIFEDALAIVASDENMNYQVDLAPSYYGSVDLWRLVQVDDASCRAYVYAKGPVEDLYQGDDFYLQVVCPDPTCWFDGMPPDYQGCEDIVTWYGAFKPATSQ